MQREERAAATARFGAKSDFTKLFSKDAGNFKKKREDFTAPGGYYTVAPNNSCYT